MATGKKSFVLYTDLHETVKQLPDNKAGILFKTILGYVNDENPVVKDLLIKIAFEPVKLQLKRDLKKWEKEHTQRILAGQASAEARRLAKEQAEREATESNDRSTTVDENEQASTVNGIVTGTVNVTKLFEPFLKELNELWKRQFKPVDRYKSKFVAAINNGYTVEDILKAAGAAKKDKHHIENNFKWLTPEFICRPEKIDTFLQAATIEQEQQQSSMPAFRKNGDTTN